MVTSNHIHVLVYDREGRDVIPDSMQRVAGRSGQEYNHRTQRKGAYWEDRYHATAVGRCCSKLAGYEWEAALERELLGRQRHWMESIPVGRPEYVEALLKQLGSKANGREIMPVERGCQLKETESAYQGLFEGEKGVQALKTLSFGTDLSTQRCLSLVRPRCPPRPRCHRAGG